MKRYDERGCSVSGASATALDTYERALAAFRSWRNGAETLAAAAQRESPHFVMAHVLQAWLLLCSRDPRRVRAARPIYAHARLMRADEFEQLHLAAIGALLDDQFPLAQALLGRLLEARPRDLLALQVAHALDYATGNVERMSERIERVLPAWSDSVPGYHAVLAMHAFGLEEDGELERAEHRARAALELNPQDARAHHVMAHVFEMGDRAEAGVRWMNEHIGAWQPDTTIATHGWWHLALFHLARSEAGGALALYDSRVRAQRSAEVSDLIDASSLLWRIELMGAEFGLDTGARWAELAQAWDKHVDDTYCSFNDVHAMLAFVGAHDEDRARRLESALARSHARPTRHGETTRRLGLPACRALMAFGRGDDSLAVPLLASLPTFARHLGGSHAQRGVLHLTLLHSIERMRRRSRRLNGTSDFQASTPDGESCAAGHKQEES